MRTIIVFGLLAIGSPANAQASKICKLEASFNAALREVNPQEFVAEISKKCTAGDVISAPASHTYVLKKVCDFQRQIVFSRNEWICVYQGSVRAD